jgi:hypothetical protein
MKDGVRGANARELTNGSRLGRGSGLFAVGFRK